MKSTKRLIFLELIVLLLAVVMFAQATWAYFSSQAKTSGTITSGSVKIVLYESAVKRDSSGNLVEDNESAKIFGTSTGTVHDHGVVFPGQNIFKNPTIQNTGTNDAYIAAKMTITDGDGDIHRVIGFPDYDEIDVVTLFGGGYFDSPAHFGDWNGLHNVTYNDDFAMVQVPKRAEGQYDVYFFFTKPIAHGESITVFDQMFFPSEFSSNEMKEFSELRVDIYGFGVQTFGFETSFDAMLGALPEHFSDLAHSAP